MAYVVERNLVHGTRFMGMYLGTEGKKRSAGAFPSRREAQRAAHREEQKVLAGSTAARVHPGCCTQNDAEPLRSLSGG
jgi:hypothetical protein